MQSVQSIRSPQGEESKAVLLHPRIKTDGMAFIVMTLKKICRLIIMPDSSTWSPKISELVKSSQIDLTPYNLKIDYDYWNYRKYVQ